MAMALTASAPLVLVGAGNMGGALLSGWLRRGGAGSSVIVVAPSLSDEIGSVVAQAGARHVTAAPLGVTAGIVFLAVKPQIMDSVLPPLKPLVGPDTVVVSIAAGKALAYLESFLGKTAAVRAMPNTPAMIGRGITGAYANAEVSAAQRAQVETLLKVSGPVEWLEKEQDIDAVTALSGSGPAYVFYLVECMAEAGRKAGLPADLAMRLARKTVAGAGELLYQSPAQAAQLRANVTSPGGTTAAALTVLMDGQGMQPLFDKALAAAKQRAEELAN